MKFAPVISEKYDPASLSNYHLILAHEVVQNKEYCTYFKELADDHTIILDNGTVELGYTDIPMIRQALDNLQREVIVIAPDFLADTDKTLEATKEFISTIDLPENRVMIVPQGKTWSDWVDCFDEMFSFGGFDYVGIPRISEDLPGGRSWLHQKARSIVRSKYGLNKRMTYHLLGIQHNLAELDWSRHFTDIMGVDSSVPLKAASTGLECKDIVDFRKLTDDVEFSETIYKETRARTIEMVNYVSWRHHVTKVS